MKANAERRLFEYLMTAEPATLLGTFQTGIKAGAGISEICMWLAALEGAGFLAPSPEVRLTRLGEELASSA